MPLCCVTRGWQYSTGARSISSPNSTLSPKIGFAVCHSETYHQIEIYMMSKQGKHCNKFYFDFNIALILLLCLFCILQGLISEI